MEELNLFSLMYTFFRLSPFIIVSFFALGSILLGEIRGFIYGLGLLFSIVLIFIIFNMTPNNNTLTSSIICKNISLNGTINNVAPLGLAILSYTFFYLLYPILKYKSEGANIGIIILFPILLLAEIIWNIKFACFEPTTCVYTLIIACLFGIMYASIIDSLKLPRLNYLNIGSNKEICSKPTNQRFRCSNGNGGMNNHQVK
jgi:hypothetical protein